MVPLETKNDSKTQNDVYLMKSSFLRKLAFKIVALIFDQ